MKKYINTSNYYLSTTTSKIEENTLTWSFDVADVTVDWVALPLQWYYWVDVDFGDASKREIFRIVSRSGYNLTYDMRISPNGRHTHQSGASVWLRDFSQLLNSLSTNTDNFWEVEQTWDLTIKVRWGILYNPSNTNAETGKKTINDTDFTLPVNTTTYIVVEYDEILWYQFTTKSSLLLEETWQYPIAKITTGLNMISENGIIDLRATIIWQGNMRSEVYDPDWIANDVFDMDNMKQGENNLYVAPAQIALWDSYQTTKQNLLISWVNIKTINNETLLTSWNINTEFKLQAGTFWEYVSQWEETYTLVHTPLNNNSEDWDYSFIVYNEGWQQQREWEDYSYDSDTLTFTFYEFWDTKSYRIFVITASWEAIGWEYNQFVTQNEYNNLPESKTSNNIAYHIYTVE